MNEKSLVTMFRPDLKQQQVSVDAPALAPGEQFINPRWLTQDHPQAWSRWGVEAPGDGHPLPFLHRSFASLLLPWLPAADESEV